MTINPLALEVTAPSEAVIDEVFKVEARIRNKGEEKINNVQAEIIPPQGLVLVTKKQIQKAGAIPGQKDRKVQWRVKVEKSGNYVIAVSARGELRGQAVSTEATIMVPIIKKVVGLVNKEESGSSQSSSGLWQGFLNFFRNWLKL